MEEYLTIKEFAGLIRVHTNTIRNSIKNGKLQSVRVGIGKRACHSYPTSADLKAGSRTCRSSLAGQTSLSTSEAGALLSTSCGTWSPPCLSERGAAWLRAILHVTDGWREIPIPTSQ